MNGAGVPAVKAEPDYNIKAEPGTSPMALDDDDIYEDTGDLDFAEAHNPLWLIRLPKSLWENWSKLDDDEEFPIGMLRVEKAGQETKRVSGHSVLSGPSTDQYLRSVCASMTSRKLAVFRRTTHYFNPALRKGRVPPSPSRTLLFSMRRIRLVIGMHTSTKETRRPVDLCCTNR